MALLSLVLDASVTNLLLLAVRVLHSPQTFHFLYCYTGQTEATLVAEGSGLSRRLLVDRFNGYPLVSMLTLKRMLAVPYHQCVNLTSSFVQKVALWNVHATQGQFLQAKMCMKPGSSLQIVSQMFHKYSLRIYLFLKTCRTNSSRPCMHVNTAYSTVRVQLSFHNAPMA